MGMVEDVKILKDQVSLMSDYFVEEQKKAKGKSKKAKIPRMLVGKVRRDVKNRRVLIPFFGSDKKFTFTTGFIRDEGLVEVNGVTYEYDPEAVYVHPKKRVPVIGIIGYRLSPVGGKIDVLASKCVGGEVDANNADLAKIKNHAQRTIIRNIQAEEIEAENAKKKKKTPIIMWIIIGVALLFLASKFFGGGA